MTTEDTRTVSAQEKFYDRNGPYYTVNLKAIRERVLARRDSPVGYGDQPEATDTKVVLDLLDYIEALFDVRAEERDKHQAEVKELTGPKLAPMPPEAPKPDMSGVSDEVRAYIEGVESERNRYYGALAIMADKGHMTGVARGLSMFGSAGASFMGGSVVDLAQEALTKPAHSVVKLQDEIVQAIKGIVDERERLRVACVHVASILVVRSDGHSRQARQILEAAVDPAWQDPLLTPLLRAEAELEASRRALLYVNEILVNYDNNPDKSFDNWVREFGNAIEATKYLKRPEWTGKFGDGETPPEPHTSLIKVGSAETDSDHED